MEAENKLKSNLGLFVTGFVQVFFVSVNGSVLGEGWD